MLPPNQTLGTSKDLPISCEDLGLRVYRDAASVLAGTVLLGARIANEVEALGQIFQISTKSHRNKIICFLR